MITICTLREHWTGNNFQTLRTCSLRLTVKKKYDNKGTLESFSSPFQTLIFDKSVGLIVQLHIIETYGIMIMRALRHRGDGGKLIILRLNALEEYMTDLITWQQRVDKLLSSDNRNTAKTCQPQRPHWEPRTKADVRADVIGKFLKFLSYSWLLFFTWDTFPSLFLESKNIGKYWTTVQSSAWKEELFRILIELVSHSAPLALSAAFIPKSFHLFCQGSFFSCRALLQNHFFTESSKGCTLFTISRAGVSPLRIAYAIGRKAFLMRWRHQEEWISLNTDTADGFELEAEVGLPETPTLLTLLSCISSTPW